jgi:Cytochrome C biogenesis protein transmembrane region
MLASINPLGERSRNRRWGATFAWYVAGSVAGGIVMGALFGLLGAGLVALFPHADTTTAVLVLGFGLVAVAFETHLFGLRLPTVIRQVDEDWIPRYRAWVYAGGFGFQLGLGVVTIVTSAAVYLTWILAVLTGSVWGGVVIGATFGVVRALPMLLVAHADTPPALRTRLREFNAAAPLASRVTLVTVVAVPVFALVALGIGGGA